MMSGTLHDDGVAAVVFVVVVVINELRFCWVHSKVQKLSENNPDR